MNRKLDTSELDIPKDDIECWERYTKHRWVYDMSRLLDSQGIVWTPYESHNLLNRELNMELYSIRPLLRQPGYIYINRPQTQHLHSEVYVIKGEIKLMRHIDPVTVTQLDPVIGDLELRINAFITLHFQKFTGVVSLETYAAEIHRVRLRPHLTDQYNISADIAKLLKRIYKRTDITLSGPADQVLHETLAS